MEEVKIIKEEIRRRMKEAFRDANDGGMTELRIASQYEAEYSALKYLLQYIECEVR